MFRPLTLKYFEDATTYQDMAGVVPASGRATIVKGQNPGIMVESEKLNSLGIIRHNQATKGRSFSHVFSQVRAV